MLEEKQGRRKGIDPRLHSNVNAYQCLPLLTARPVLVASASVVGSACCQLLCALAYVQLQRYAVSNAVLLLGSLRSLLCLSFDA